MAIQYASARPCLKRIGILLALVLILCLAAACLLRPLRQSSPPEIVIALPPKASFFRERPFAVWSEAHLPLFALSTSFSLGPAVPMRQSEQVLITKLSLTDQRQTAASALQKRSCGASTHVLVNSVISAGGLVVCKESGPGWTTTREALQLTGLHFIKNITCGRPASIPIITPKGRPYVLDILLRGTAEQAWQTVRFVDFRLSPQIKDLVRIGVQQIGRPYVWGGINDFGLYNTRSLWHGKRVRGFDCSGLVLYVYQQMGIEIPWRTTAEQWRNLQPVNRQDILPGDLVFWAQRDGRIYHVGIVLGDVGASPDNATPDGEWDMLHAPRKNQTVRVEYGFFSGPMRGVAGFRTLIGYNGYTGY